MSRRPAVLSLGLISLLLAGQLLLFSAIARAAEMEIASAEGPLTRVITSDTLSCQVAHRDDEEFEFYPSEATVGSCGTFLAVADTVYGPLGGSPTLTPWTPVTQTLAGSSLITVVDGQPAGVRVQQIDSYVVGGQSYRTDIQLTNATAAPLTGVLYRAGDCYLQGEDEGLVRVDGGSPACIVNPAEGRRIEQWLPITPGNHFFAGGYGDVWTLISGRQNFPDTCECAVTADFDNGAGISWSVDVAPGQTVTFSHETFFSPVGRGPVSEPFRDSVPDPTQITLDPVVIAQSVAISAGVILLVPFPSALFNSTLTDNYDEVMAGVGAVRHRARGLRERFVAWVRGRVAARRAARGGAQGTATPEPQPVLTPGPEPHLTPGPARGDLWRTPLGILGFIGLSALLYAFLDPTFGFSLESLGTLLGLGIGLAVVLVAYGVPLIVLSRRGSVGLTVRALPATLIVALLCVLISRITDFQPGYLYGLIIGFFFAHGVSRELEGRAEAAAAASTLAAAFVAWVALAVLNAAGPTTGFSAALLGSAAVTIVVAGLENAVFAMLPLRFLPGASVFAWDRRVWAALIGLGIFGFAHVLLNPAAGAGYLADTTRTSFVTLIILLALFGIASVIFWAWFRFRRQPARPTGETG